MLSLRGGFDFLSLKKQICFKMTQMLSLRGGLDLILFSKMTDFEWTIGKDVSSTFAPWDPIEHVVRIRLSQVSRLEDRCVLFSEVF